LGLNIGLLKSLSLFYDRFQLLSQIFLVLMSGAGLYYLSGYMNAGSRYGKYSKVLFLVCLISFSAIAVRTPKKVFYEHTGQLGTLENSACYKDVHSLWTWLDKNVRPHNERIYMEDTYKSLRWNNSDNPESNKSHVLALTSIYTGISQINGWCGYTHYFAREHECGMGGCLFGYNLAESTISNKQIHEEMKLLNCRYIVAHTETVKHRLAQAPFLRKVEQIGPFDIFDNLEFTSAWAYNFYTGEKQTLRKSTPISYELTAKGNQNELVLISLANKANWKAYYRGREIPIHDHKALMQVILPAQGIQTIELKYKIDKINSIISMCLGIILTILYIIVTYIGHSRKMVTLTDGCN